MFLFLQKAYDSLINKIISINCDINLVRWTISQFQWVLMAQITLSYETYPMFCYVYIVFFILFVQFSKNKNISRKRKNVAKHRFCGPSWLGELYLTDLVPWWAILFIVFSYLLHTILYFLKRDRAWLCGTLWLKEELSLTYPAP